MNTSIESKEPLLSRSSDPFHHSNDRYNLKRRKNSSSNNVLPKLPEEIAMLLPKPEFMSQSKFNLGMVFVYLGMYFTLGTLSFYLLGDQIKGEKTNGFLDAMYFCVVTMTTVGYGDLVLEARKPKVFQHLVPNSVPAKLLSCVFVFGGMCLVGFTLSNAADYIVEKEEIHLVKMMHMREKVGSSDILKEVENNKVYYKFLFTLTVLILLVVAGITVLYEAERLDLVDAIYCVCATISTLGYGDNSFSTEGGRLFAVFWILISTICLGQFFLYIAELQTEKRQRSLIKSTLGRNLTRYDLEASDLDHDNTVSAAEFIVYKLKEMGKISEGDITVMMESFEKLDVDHSGTLTSADLVGSQSSQGMNTSGR